MLDLTKPLFRQTDWSGVTDPMTDEEVKAWLVELRAGKFDQAQEQLCDGLGYCCLGVLAETQGLFDTYGLMFGDGSLTKWKFDVDGPSTHFTYKLPENIQDTLATLNDDGSSFAELADIIETGFFGTAEASKEDLLSLFKAIEEELEELKEQEETID